MIINFDKKYVYLFIVLLVVIYIFLLIKTAWLSDDAYITFRTIDNFLNGLGLRWNISERVQSFTHPLWLFLLSGIYFFTKEIFFTSLITSIVISIITVAILLVKLSPSIDNKLIVILAVIFSKAFLDYCTSGLENPLTNLLLVLYAFVYFRDDGNKVKVFLLSLLLGAILTNRIDSFLLIFPSFIFYIFKNNSYKYFALILSGFFPFIFWELFSLWYYGFPFPNTAYAKLKHGIPQTEIIIEGLNYFKESFLLDPLTLTIIFLSVVLTFIKRIKILVSYVIGIILYLFYIIWIGGDFMAGRFFTAPFIISLVMLAGITWAKKTEYLMVLFLLIVTGVISLNNNLFNSNFNTNSNSVVDERLLYYRHSNLLGALRGKEMPNHNWVIQGKQAKKDNLKIVELHSTGFFGFYAGGDCHIIDKLGLCDPLLSKLPCEMPWRIGHYQRNIPIGYEESLRTGTNQIEDPNLAKYYENVVLITRGCLTSINRLEAIWKMNTGQFNYLLESYSPSIDNHY